MPTNLTEYLRVKRNTLAAEARIIKVQEARALRKGRKIDGLFTGKERADLRASLKKTNIYTPAELSDVISEERDRRRAIKSNKSSAPSYAHYNGLRAHRLMTVRPAARVAHLAHAYLKGMPYLRVEGPKTRHTLGELHFKAISETVRKFSDNANTTASHKDVRLWSEGGRTLNQIVEDAKAQEADKATAA